MGTLDIEATPDRQPSIDSSVAEYKAGRMQLMGSETNQLAYRLAKELNLPSVYGVDYRDAEFPFDSLMKSAAAAGQMNVISFVQKTIDTVQKSFNEALQKSTITQMLMRENTPEAIEMQLEFYLKLLPVGTLVPVSKVLRSKMSAEFIAMIVLNGCFGISAERMPGA